MEEIVDLYQINSRNCSAICWTIDKMMVTRSRNKNLKAQVFKHVIEVILGMDLVDPIPTSLATDGLDSILDIVGLDMTQIQGLQYMTIKQDRSTTLSKLIRGHIGLLSALGPFVLYKAQKGEFLLKGDWLSVTQDEFDEYRASAYLERPPKGYGINFPWKPKMSSLSIKCSGQTMKDSPAMPDT